LQDSTQYTHPRYYTLSEEQGVRKSKRLFNKIQKFKLMEPLY